MEGFLGIGGNELVIILIFAFLIFGPDKLPQIARTLGRAIARFRDAQNEVSEVIRSEVIDPAVNQEKGASGPSRSNTAFTGGVQTDTESFAERKARYDKIRAERQERENKARQQMAQEIAASKSPQEKRAANDANDGAGTPDASAASNEAAPSDQELDMLFGYTGAGHSPLSTAGTPNPAEERAADAQERAANGASQTGKGGDA